MSFATNPSLGAVVAQKYRLDREVGRGGMGVVFAATDLSLGRPVALKLLLGPTGAPQGTPGSTTSPEDTARFMREARATASMRGDHVAQVYEAGVTPDGVPFLAMELLHGQDLDSYVHQRGALSIPEACDLMLQACAALVEAHGLGIVHRDLKPQNFFILPPRDASGPKLKLLDFGISKMHSEADLALTQTTMTMGSPRYMSPEQVRSSKYVDHRADLWALGAVLHEALTANPLFNETTASALHAQIVADPATPLRHVRHDAPPELEQVILRCVEKDPNRRFGSAVELAYALAPFASAHGRELANMLLQRHSMQLPPVYTPGQHGARIATHTPGFTATGHPVPARLGTTGAPRPARKSNLWLWIAVGIATCTVFGIGFFACVAVALVQETKDTANYGKPPIESATPPTDDEPDEPDEPDDEPLASARSAVPRAPSAPTKPKPAPSTTPSARPSASGKTAPSPPEDKRRPFIPELADQSHAQSMSSLAKNDVDLCLTGATRVRSGYRPGGPTYSVAMSACRACEKTDGKCFGFKSQLEDWRTSAYKSFTD